MPLQDDTYLACAGVAVSTGVNNGFESTGIGPVGRIQVYDIVPLTIETNNLATTQTTTAATKLTLTAGTGITGNVTVNGQSCLQLDVPRALGITSDANDSAHNFTVNGYDFYQTAMSETIAGGNISAQYGKKAWMYVYSITSVANRTGNITVRDFGYIRASILSYG